LTENNIEGRELKEQREEKPTGTHSTSEKPETPGVSNHKKGNRVIRSGETWGPRNLGKGTALNNHESGVNQKERLHLGERKEQKAQGEAEVFKRGRNERKRRGMRLHGVYNCKQEQKKNSTGGDDGGGLSVV